MNAQEISQLSTKWIELVKSTVKGSEFVQRDIVMILDVTAELEDYSKFSGDGKWLSEIEATVQRGIELAKKYGYEMPTESTDKPSLTAAQENAKLHSYFAKLDKWNEQGLDQWGMAPVRWDLIR